MKRAGDLFDKVTDLGNSRLAISNALKTKIWKRGARNVLLNAEEYALLISERPETDNIYRAKTVVDKASGKQRNLLIPTPLDLCRQHQLMQVLTPVFEKGFYEHSYACRKGYGFMKCASYVKRKVRAMSHRRTYFAKVDIVHYYENVDHETIKAQFRRIIKDGRVLRLLDNVVDGTGSDKGIPIGNFTSQIFANVYLTPADRYAKQVLRVPVYVRYADDMLLLSHNKRELKRQVVEMVSYLKRELHLECHAERISIRELSDDGEGFIDFCGFKYYKGHVGVRKRTFNRIRRTVRKLAELVTLRRSRSYMSYLGYLKRADCHGWELANERFEFGDLRVLISAHDRNRFAHEPAL